MLLVRVKTNSTDAREDFVLLAGDCYHHLAMLGDLLLCARPPFNKLSMYSDPETAIDMTFRTKRCAEEEYVWVVGAHDFREMDCVSPKTHTVKDLVPLMDWRERGWKR